MTMSIENRFRLVGCITLAGLLSFAIFTGEPEGTPEATQEATAIKMGQPDSEV